MAPEVVNARRISRGRDCGIQIKLLEAAKSAWKRDHSGETLAESDLLALLDKTEMPCCPLGGVYTNVLNVDAVIACSLNGVAGYEETTPGYPDNANGIHDASK